MPSRVRRDAHHSTGVLDHQPACAATAIKHKIREFTTRSTLNHSLKALLSRLNAVLRGWATYFRYDASKRTLAYVDYLAWWRVFRWLRRKHPKRTTQYLRVRYCGGRWSIAEGGTELFRPSKVKVERYRFRGTRILLPWMDPDELGMVGRFARSNYDDSAFLGALEEDLAAHNADACGKPDAR